MRSVPLEVAIISLFISSLQAHKEAWAIYCHTPSLEPGSGSLSLPFSSFSSPSLSGRLEHDAGTEWTGATTQQSVDWSVQRGG